MQEVVPGGPGRQGRHPRRAARRAPTGVAAGGDLIVELDGAQDQQPDDIAAAIADNKPGDQVAVKYLRGGKQREAHGHARQAAAAQVRRAGARSQRAAARASCRSLAG